MPESQGEKNQAAGAPESGARALEERVEAAYRELAQQALREGWSFRFDVHYLISKYLVDYTLLAEVPLGGARVLNVGCGEPIDEWHYAERIARWVALDSNHAGLLAARTLLGNSLHPALLERLCFLEADAARLPLPGEQFDVVVSFSAIDHIPSAAARLAAIDEMCRVLRRPGWLVLTVPNRLDWWYSHRSRKFQRSGTAPFGYEYQFFPWEISRRLQRNGMEILRFTSTALNPAGSYLDRVLGKLHLGSVKALFGTRMGFLARKPHPAR